jgi:DNA sulfur modification protein DndB
MGSTTYYEALMTAGELVRSVRPARETDDWASASIDERMQREVNETRVRKTIVPYLAQHPDRFFGSFIVLVQRGTIEFEPMNEIAKNLPAAYRKGADNMGFLTIGSEDLVALDGQHRLVAFRDVITAGGSMLAPDVGNDEVCVLFIEHETAVKTRRIFNKVNRNAKPTGKSDNIITSEDDGYAIVTRMLLDRDLDAPLSSAGDRGSESELVNWKSNTLSKGSTKVTTLSALYETVTDILTDAGFEDLSEKDSPVAPPEDVVNAAYEVAAEWWEALLTMDDLAKAVADLSAIPEMRLDSLLLRPAGQIALVRGLTLARQLSRGQLEREELIRRANKVDWVASASSYWRDVMVKPNLKMIARKEAYDMAARLLAYLIASEYVDDETKHKLWQDWNERRGRDPFADPEDLEDEQLPEDLPDPVA